jgi:hypothetical protein
MFHPFSRRKFIRHMGIAAAGFTIVPRHVLGKGYISPSDKLNIAAIGAGGKATFNITQAWNKGAENIAVLCDVDDRMSADMRKKFPSAKYYKDYREMLDKEAKSIDAVMVTTPDHMHYMQTIAVMQLGKHVYTEKPLTHDIAEARLLTEAEQQYKVITQMPPEWWKAGCRKAYWETYIPFTYGPTAQSGRKVFPGQQASIPFLPNLIGTCGWVPPRTGNSTKLICPPPGADGGIMAPDHWEIWVVILWMCLLGLCDWDIRKK